MRKFPYASFLSRAKRLVGIVALGDLARDPKLGGRVLKRVSERAEPNR
ncbi:MAG TPA: hypothetical protein VFM04_04410 [Candidatus Methylomirabilis sp.]|nr:hypothetical protein [Candidatus Methylomirabilis sp.]